MTIKTCEFCDAVVVATPTCVYTVSDRVRRDNLCHGYRCAFKADETEWQGVFRIARDSFDNDLVKNEAQPLFCFQTRPTYDDFKPFLSHILESFLYQDPQTNTARQANIVRFHERIKAPNELYSLQEVQLLHCQPLYAAVHDVVPFVETH